MSISRIDGEALWDSFLHRWPLETLGQITLNEYTKSGDSDCFTVGWLEKATEDLGSIWGGSSFKFGVYSRKDTSDKEGGAGRSYSPEYGWYSKYGATPEQAFQQVRAIVVAIANAARSGNFDAIEKADLGPAVKWKIAFLYQDRSEPTVLPVFSAAHLAAYLAQSSKVGFSYLQKETMSKRGDVDVLTFGRNVWDQAEALLSALVLKPEDALLFFQEHPERFQQIKPPTKYIAGFRTSEGRSLAVSRKQNEAKLWLEQGAWLDTVKGQLRDIEVYPSERSRSSNLAANAPSLDKGHPALFLTVPSRAALVALCDAYDNTDSSENNPMTSTDTPLPIPELVSLNQILYGPPGTGKTFKTAMLAVKICGGDGSLPREELMVSYDKFQIEGRVSFVTFHQSYGYEDFVEGLRPEIVDGQVSYRVRPGIFRQACEAAKSSTENHVLIIDEINRANISKVLGELITLLEPDKREGEINAITVRLPYSGESFSVPSNLYVIGTMNTADRSIALLDTALRRRFEFDELQPDYSILHSVGSVDLGAMLKKLNDNVEFLYDRDHTIGHAYFINVKTLADLDVVFRRKVIPLLQEYFYEDLSKVRSVLNEDGGFFVKEKMSAPKGTEEFGEKYKYRVKDVFQEDAFLNIYS